MKNTKEIKSKSTKNVKSKLEAIYTKYSNIEYNQDNYSIGGGLDDWKFASVRHEDAKNDGGKVTLGEATQMFKKATGLDTLYIREILNFAIPQMEWHHAGQLPKSYGGGMKKTYFLNAEQICDCAQNFHSYEEKMKSAKKLAKELEIMKKNVQERKEKFLKDYAQRVERVEVKPSFFIQEKREMNGKFGWFDSTYKSYKLPEYYSGWAFDSIEKKNEYLNIN